MDAAVSKNWLSVMDRDIPAWVKKKFLRDAHSKKEPAFNVKDAYFFLKSLQELSDLFTTDRDNRRKLRSYFEQARYQSAYLLYWLPLQAAKLQQIYSKHAEAFEKIKSKSEITIADIGCGPATASLATLLALAPTKAKIRVHLWDSQRKILELARELLLYIGEKLELDLEIVTQEIDLRRRLPNLPKQLDLLLASHVFNELESDKFEIDRWVQTLLERSQISNFIFIEPAAKMISQTLSKTRDKLFAQESSISKTHFLIGPCLHAGACPLAMGRDWCHSSQRSQIPGRWFDFYSVRLGSRREFLKYSYLWISNAAVKAKDQSFRVVSDPLRDQQDRWKVLLCEPQRTKILPIAFHMRDRFHRGDIYLSSRDQAARKRPSASKARFTAGRSETRLK